MKQHGFKKLLFALFLVWTSLCIITPAALALDETTLSGIPGAEQWQPYLEQSPVSISDFADAPLDAVQPGGRNAETVRDVAQDDHDEDGKHRVTRVVAGRNRLRIERELRGDQQQPHRHKGEGELVYRVEVEPS